MSVAFGLLCLAAVAAPRTERNRLRMELVRPEQPWLVSEVQRL